jgi:ABC-type multidrug transport system fused ATPase/permease subunit
MLTTLRKLFDLLSPRERRRFVLLCFMVLVMGIANIVGIAAILPFLHVLGDPQIIHTNAILSTLYDGLGFASDRSFLIFLGVAVTLVFFSSVAIRAVTAWALLRFGAMRNYSIATRLLSAYLRQPYPWFLRRHSADLVKTVLTEVAQAVNGVVLPLLNMFANAVVVGGLIILLVSINPLAAGLLATVMGGGYLVVFSVVQRRLQRAGKQRFTSNQQRFMIAQEAFAGIKEIKVMGLETSATGRFDGPARTFGEAMATDSVLGEVPRHLLEGVAFGGMMLVLLALIIVSEGALAEVLPVAGVYALAGARLTPALQVVYRAFNKVRFNRAAVDAIHADYMAAMAIEAPAGLPEGVAAPRLRQTLELRGVGYAYPQAERTALSDLSLAITANTTVGIVGGTGAGKTTAMDIILGLLIPQTGALAVDGAAIDTDRLRRAWRGSLGYVPQQIFLTDDTVAANIAFGRVAGDIDMAAVEHAARMAQLHDFVMTQMDDGYQSRVGDRGVRLSGGQRQRIGIARALYHDPDVLILDEATSALDNITERAVMESVALLGGKKTIIMVAHRLSTVRNCDQIFLLGGGGLEAQGTYDELIERSDAFREMTRAAE